MAQQLETIEQWVAMLREADLPVLGSTVIELRRIQEDEDGATPQRVADAVLHDPFMTVKVLLYLQEHRGRRRNADITTIPHALMMLGMSPFFDHFGVQMALEDWLTNDAVSLTMLVTFGLYWFNNLPVSACWKLASITHTRLPWARTRRAR